MVPWSEHTGAGHDIAVQLSDQMQVVAACREGSNAVRPTLGSWVWQLQKSSKHVRLGHVTGDGGGVRGSGASDGDGGSVHLTTLLGFEPENKKARWVSGPCEGAGFLPLVHMIRLELMSWMTSAKDIPTTGTWYELQLGRAVNMGRFNQNTGNCVNHGVDACCKSRTSASGAGSVCAGKQATDTSATDLWS
jgi:hypothetical protein